MLIRITNYCLLLVSLLSLNNSSFPVQEVEFAEVYLFRPKQFQGGAITFQVVSGDKTLTKLSNGSKVVYRVYKEGALDLKLKASVFTSKSVNFGIVKGQKYYIKAGYGDGFGSNLSFILMNEEEGAKLYTEEVQFRRSKPKVINDDPERSMVLDAEDLLRSADLQAELEEEVVKKAGPNISWLSPSEEKEVSGVSTYTLQICLKGYQNPLNLKLFVNDKLYEYRKDIPLSKRLCAYNYIKNVKLKAGDNELKVVLEDGEDEFFYSKTIRYEERKNSYRGLALVIGNSEYSFTEDLRNPKNDAEGMAEALETLGFEVLKATNLSKQEMKNLIGNYLAKLQSYSTGIFFYAGHGIQYEGKNYLIPVDVSLSDNSDIAANCVDTGSLLTNMSLMELKTSLMILDACRNNPFKGIGQEVSDINSGLTGTDAPAGSLVAFATAPGKTASDGEEENGLYTQEILNSIYQRNLKVEELFKRVRINVMAKSRNRQIPWETSSLINDFYFNPPAS